MSMPWLLISIPLLLLLVLFILGNFFYNLTIVRKTKNLPIHDPALEKTVEEIDWETSEAWAKKQELEHVNVLSIDEIQLCGLYISAPSSTTKTAILVHGYGGKGSNMIPFAQYYVQELGFNVLMPDCRGHDHSGGQYIGFGWDDRKDCLKWIDWITKRIGTNAEIVLHGISMGGSIVLMTCGEKLPPQVKCIISDCAYTSVEDILGYELKRMYKLPKFPMVYITSLICKLRAGYFFHEASALKQVRKCTKPIFFIHGGNDEFIPPSMAHELHSAATCHKQLLIVPNAVHATSFWTDTQTYKREVKKFIEKHMP
jgi:fermentation-respiration switch protein FrsA (DUF1100 family)